MFEGKPNQRIVLFAGMVVAAVLVAAVFSANQSMQSATAQTEDDVRPSTLSTTGTATTQVQPDKFRVTASVVTNATSAQDAASENAEIMDDVIADLQALGIEEEDMGTSNYVLYPVYQDKPPAEVCIQVYPPPPECLGGQVITGYRVSNTVSVTLDVNGTVSAGSVIDAAVDAGANTVDGVFFFISDEMQQQVRDGLIEEAVNNARHRADIAAEAVGTQVTGVQSVTINDVQFPFFPRGPEAAPGGGDTQILPGQQQVTSSVSITFYVDNSVAAGAG